MTTEHKLMCSKILQHYGKGPQLHKLVEECCELGQAAMKFDYKQTSTNAENLFEELADVKIMIEQISSAIDGLSHEHINEIIDYKLKRQLERIKNERNII
uniref:Nucleoside triphosphate pyrophosphohydrolase n=1 Tax=Siphoviridae sp. cto6l14 TaxID=2827590 RepID=A0A8S5LP19_9CAUD|nr:MAG TPA: nucleoside triphosphate pyrophosphohydrolase [Siphoviridae sp. cto6l14]